MSASRGGESRAGQDHWISVRGLRLHVRTWDGAGVPFVLLHGLASNCLTWEVVARLLNAAGHHVVSVDQRGHGLSDKPEQGYDYGEVTADLASLLDLLDLTERPVVAGQSWGGSVVLEFAARYPERGRGIVLVDGGFNSLRASRPQATWDEIASDLRPPALAGLHRGQLAERIRHGHPDWSHEGVEHTLANFETLDDGTIRPWLSLDRHLQILRALWEHDHRAALPQISTPILTIAAGPSDPGRAAQKRSALDAFAAAAPHCRAVWLDRTDHDIHVQRPEMLARLMLDALADGFFSPKPRA
jgi:pimeloyl-ACP methyl ester carboxylesterase